MITNQDKTFPITPIAHIRTDFAEKFGIPRQSGLVDELEGRIVFEPEYRIREAFRELESFSHIWIIWQFSKSMDGGWHPTVRPPRLGGNKRVGVFASRSPFRPNSLGLSCVKLKGIDYSSPDSPALIVSGIDLLDKTPIFDIKPYIPVADCHPEATEGYTSHTKEHKLPVEFKEGLDETIPREKRAALIGLLSNDPRPGYDLEGKEYGLTFAEYEIKFKVADGVLKVYDITHISHL